jgi:hypothetical protein
VRAALPVNVPEVPARLPAWPLGLSKAKAVAAEAGERWDAVRITGELAFPVLSAMIRWCEGDIGPVIIDLQGGCHYWLIPAQHPATWSFPNVTLLTTGTWVVLPPTLFRVRRVHWFVDPDPDTLLAAPELLHKALTTLAGA